MTVERFPIEGLLLLTPRLFHDDRGYFFESFNQRQFEELSGWKAGFVQDNESVSAKGVLRGLHFQIPPMAQGKLVRVIKGAVLDVAVDLRKESPTYGQHIVVELSDANKCQLWIPPGFAHGFLSLEDQTVFSYKCTDYYSGPHEQSIQWNDRDLAIDWGIKNPLLSDKDAVSPDFRTFNSPF